MHIPISYPDNPPEFYIAKKKSVCINEQYIKNNMVNGDSFQIYSESFCRFNPTKNNIGEIIDNLLVNFTQD